MILERINVDSDKIDSSHLLSKIDGMHQITKEWIDEFEIILTNMFAYCRETGSTELINYCGQFDLLITPMRVHVILITDTYDLPIIESV